MAVDLLSGVEATVALAIAEDLGDGDITAQLIDAASPGSATVITRQDAVVCGRPWVDAVFRQIDASVNVDWLVTEGSHVQAGSRLFRVAGPARSLLTAERTALNFLQTLSGTATRTARYVAHIAHTRARLLDTRKTIPGLRLAQKYAVRTGGGENHRIGLYDAFLVKENHIAAAGSIRNAIARARAMHPDRRLEIEVENMDEFREAMDCGPDWIMLDNFAIGDLEKAVAATNRGGGNEVFLEASGGIETVPDLVRIAETGVDYISVGALTKHCEAIDLSMRFD